MFFEAGGLLTLARLMVNLVPLSFWRNQIAVSPDAEVRSQPLSPRQREIAIAVRHSIARVSRNLPIEFVCLPQALTARWMLARRNVPCKLFIGTKREAEAEREFHAWLKSGRTMITGDCEEDDYVVFGSQARG